MNSDCIYRDSQGKFYQDLHLSPGSPSKVIGLIIRRNYSEPVSLSPNQVSKLKYVCDRSVVAAGGNSLCAGALGKLEKLSISSTPQKKLKLPA